MRVGMGRTAARWSCALTVWPPKSITERAVARNALRLSRSASELNPRHMASMSALGRQPIPYARRPSASTRERTGAEATTLSLLMRGRSAAEVFPRVRVTAVTPDNNHHRLFEGYVGSASMERMELGLSPWVRGKAVTVEVEMLNPGVSEEQRMVYLGGG